MTILNINAATNQAIAGLKIKEENVDEDYLYYFLVSLKDGVQQIGRGVAQNNINMSILKNMIVPLPPLAEQQKIAANLDKVTDLIDLHKKQLEKLDQLVKSRFIEMFGDVIQNNRGWKTHKFSDIATSRLGKMLDAKNKLGNTHFRIWLILMCSGSDLI